MTKEAWHDIHKSLLDTYPHVSVIETAEGAATVLQIPENQDSVVWVDNLRLTVTGVGLCSGIATFIEAISVEEAVQLMKEGWDLPETKTNHIVILENASVPNLIRVSTELGSRFTPEEVVGIESVLANTSAWSLVYIGPRMIAVGIGKLALDGADFEKLWRDYGDLAASHFKSSRMSGEDFMRMVESRTIWFGDMGYSEMKQCADE